MAPQFVRGNKVVALKHPPPCVAQEFYLPSEEPPYGLVRGGDKLTVTQRKLGGWLRVKNSRNGKVTNLRAGPWLALAEDVKLAVDCGGQGSQIDLLIRKSQIDKLNATVEDKDFQLKEMKMTNEKLREDNKWFQESSLGMNDKIIQLEQTIDQKEQELAGARIDYQSVKNINQHLNGLLFEKDEEIEQLRKRISQLEQENYDLKRYDEEAAVFV